MGKKAGPIDPLEYRNDSLSSLVVGNLTAVKVGDLGGHSSKFLAKPKSYNHPHLERSNSTKIESENLKLNWSGKPQMEKKGDFGREGLPLQRKVRRPLPSYNVSAKLIRDSTGAKRKPKFDTKLANPSNVTISSNVPSQINFLFKQKVPNRPRNHLSFSGQKKQNAKKFEIQDQVIYSKEDQPSRKGPLMFNFDSFNNSSNQVARVDSSKADDMSCLGKRNDFNPNNQKDIFKVESYDSRSRDAFSHISSCKKIKMSEMSKPKDFVQKEASEFDSTNPLNYQPSLNSNFQSFQANSSLLNFKEEPKFRQKKVRYSTGGQVRQSTNKSITSKKSSFKLNLPQFEVVPKVPKSDQKASSQNLSSLTDINMNVNTASIKNRVSSNTLSSKSNKNISSLPELDKKSITNGDVSKEQSKGEVKQPALHKIVESESLNFNKKM